MVTLTIEKANNLFNDIMIRGYNDRLKVDYPLTYYNRLTVNETIEEFKKLNNISDNDNIKVIDYYTIQTSGKYKTIKELKQAMENYRRSLENV